MVVVIRGSFGTEETNELRLPQFSVRLSSTAIDASIFVWSTGAFCGPECLVDS